MRRRGRADVFSTYIMMEFLFCRGGGCGRDGRGRLRRPPSGSPEPPRGTLASPAVGIAGTTTGNASVPAAQPHHSLHYRCIFTIHTRGVNKHANYSLARRNEAPGTRTAQLHAAAGTLSLLLVKWPV